ncbi:MAG: PKD domain-containing protein [Bacteroidota bacterium]
MGTNTSSGCSETLVMDNFINVGYLVEFSASVEEGCEDLMVVFQDDSTEPADGVLWEFGDGGTSTEPNPTYTYEIPGCYTVKLTRDIQGCPSVAFSSNCINVAPVPDVWYSNDNLVGCSLPHVVNFVGISTSAVAWSWDFCDGNTSDEQNPTHNYDCFGDFEVSLTVTNAQGCENTVVINTIQVNQLEAQMADIGISGCAPLDISLEDNSNSITEITNWLWEIQTPGNNLTFNTADPSFSIADTGIYDVTLIVTNTLGCMDTTTFAQAIQVGMPPVIEFEAVPVETCIEWEIQFTDLSSSFVEEWFWDFGDGNNSTQQNPVHFYTDTGRYDISLVAFHNGCASTLTKDDWVHVMAPVANFNVINFCDEPSKRRFQNLSIDADSVIWDFGIPTSLNDTSTAINPEFVYPAPGTYTVTQKVFNGETGCAHTKTEEIVITNPQAAFTVSTTQGCVPLTIDLIDGSNAAEAWQWSSPGGQLSNPTGQNPQITFDLPGKYSDIQLIIQDLNNCNDTILFTDTIYVNSVTTDFSVDIAQGCTPLSVSFTENTSSLFGNVVEWQWTFGDLGTSTEANPSFTFAEPGLHTVKLRAVDDWGCVRVRNKPAAVETTQPIASFSADTLSCTWGAVQFDNTSTGQQLTYEWDFGDGNSSTEAAPSHLYDVQGTYTVCLTIRDKFDCSDMICKDNYILIADPIANFTLDSTFASCPPLPVNFYNLSQNATQFTWDFGDGSGTSDLEEPSHVYTIPGVYHVAFIAASTEVCQDTMIVEDLIVLDGPEGTYTVDVDTTCLPATITFTANSLDNYMYIWDFGIGVLDTTSLSVSSEVISFTYTEPGTYTPLLSFVNNTGCFRTLPPIDPIYVATSAPEFEASQTLLCGTGNNAISFSNLSNSTDPIIGVTWLFEGGEPMMSTAAEPVVEYPNPGSFSVTMIIDNGICTDTLTKTDYISVAGTPEAQFFMSTEQGCAPLMINFTDQSDINLGQIDQWSWDFGNGATANIQNPTHIFTEGGDYEVRLTVTTTDGCTSTSTQIVSVIPLTAVSAGMDRDICMGEITQLQAEILGGSQGLTYQWTPSSSLSCNQCLDPLAQPNDTTIYTFTVFSPEGCASSSEVTVNVKPYPVPVIDITPDTTICADDLVQLQVSGGDNVFSYQWDERALGLSCYDNCFNPIARPQSSTIYTVTVTTIHACSSTDSVSVGVVDQFQPFAGEDQTICQGDEIQLNVNTGNDPTWLVTDGLSCVFCPDPIARPSETTAYVVSVRTDIGCEIIDTIVVNALGAEDISAGSDADVCLGDMIQLSGEGLGMPTWTPAATLDVQNVLRPEALPEETTTYYLSLENGACTLTDSVTIFVREKTNISVQDQVICRGDSIRLVLEGEVDQVEWQAMDGISDLNSSSPMVAPLTTTTFMVIGSLSSCEADTAFVTVEVNELPEVALRPVHRYFPGQMVTLSAPLRIGSQSDFEYQWFPSEGLSCTTCIAPEVDPLGQNLQYQLKVTNMQTGCEQNFQTSIQLLNECPEDLIGVPNVFSPNGDQNNDELEIFLSPAIEGIYSLQIFDRWGSLIYRTNNVNQFWDGRFKGRDLPDGVYVYLIEAPCPVNGGTFLKTGDITIIH